jgi:predicted GIY-YIG superfamily endonuclease
MANKTAGYVYLLHFDKPICSSRPAQHYVGWTKDLDERLWKHKKGKAEVLNFAPLPDNAE